MMQFTKESVHQNWMLLHGTSDIQTKSNANKYLTQFKKSPQLISICTDLFTSQNDDSIKFFSTLMIYQHIKDTIAKIIELKESFNQCKQFLLSSIFPRIPNCSELVAGNVCKAIAILVLVGKVTYWFESIDDLLQMSTTSEQNCLYASMILENCHKELMEMKVKPSLIQAIKDQCIEESSKIWRYLCSLLIKIQSNISPNTSSSVAQGKNNQILFKHILDLTHAWIKFKVNILTIPNYPLILFTALVKENRSVISEILSDSFQCSSSSLKALVSRYPNENMKEIIDIKANKDEMNIMNQIILLINNLVLNYSNKKLTSDEEELLFYTASIFSSLCTNYIYLFFITPSMAIGNNTNNYTNSINTSQVLMNLLFFFVSNSKRKVSYLFFDSIAKMSIEINNQSLISILPLSQKEEFLQLLFKINDAIIFHSKLKELKVNYDLINKTVNVKVLSSSSTTASTLNAATSDLDLLSILEEEDNSEIDTEDISIQTYRKAANEAFSDLFMLIIRNYPKGSEAYLERTGAMLIKIDNKIIDITNESILQNKDYLLLVEAVLFSIRSIRYCFNQSPAMLLNFCDFLLKSQMLKNDRILISFIIFLDSISLYIYQDKSLYVTCIKFLLSLIYNKHTSLVNISGVVILNLIENSKEYDEIVFNALSEFYMSKYNEYESNTICHLCEGIIKCFLLKQSKYIDTEIIAIGDNLLSPIAALLHLMGVNSNNNQPYDRKALIKGFSVYSIIIRYIGATSKDKLYNIYSKYASQLFNCCDRIIAMNPIDNELIHWVILLFIKSCNYLKEHCLNYFDQINNIIYSIYSKSNETYDVIYLMKALYYEALKQRYSPYSKIVIEKFCIICGQIYSNVFIIENNRLETTQLLASFISLILDNVSEFPNDCFDSDIMSKVIELFLECNRTVIQPELIGNIMRAFRKVFQCKGIQIDFKRGIFKEILGSVLSNLNHYSTNCIKDILLVLIEIRKLDQLRFEEGVKEIIDKDTAMIVIEYFNMFRNNNYNDDDDDGNNKAKMEAFISDLVKMKREELDPSIINKYAIELKAIQLKTIK